MIRLVKDLSGSREYAAPPEFDNVEIAKMAMLECAEFSSGTVRKDNESKNVLS